MDDLKKKEVTDMLSVLIMIEMNKPPLTSFKSLTAGQQKKFNLACNKYIKETLYPLNDDWEEKLKSDFNIGCTDELYVGSFKAEAQYCPILNTDIIRLRREGEPEME